MYPSQRKHYVARQHELRTGTPGGQRRQRIITTNMCMNDLNGVQASKTRELPGAPETQSVSHRQFNDVIGRNILKQSVERRIRRERDEHIVPSLRETIRETRDVLLTAADGTRRADVQNPHPQDCNANL